MSTCKQLTVKQNKDIIFLKRYIPNTNSNKFIENGGDIKEVFSGKLFNKVKKTIGERGAYNTLAYIYNNDGVVVDKVNNADGYMNRYKRSINLSEPNSKMILTKSIINTIGKKLEAKTGVTFDNNFKKAIDKDAKGYFDPINTVAFINLKKMSDDTVFHEFIHPVVTVIKNNNKKLYAQLLIDMQEDKEGALIVDRVKAAYHTLSEDEVREEALVTYIANKSAAIKIGENNLEENKRTKGFKDSLVKFFETFTKLFNDLIADKNKEITLDVLLSLNSASDLAVLMNLENEFDAEIKNEINNNFIFKNDELSIKGSKSNNKLKHSLDTKNKNTTNEEKLPTKFTDIIRDFTDKNLDVTKIKGRSYSKLVSKGYGDIAPLFPKVEGEDDKMYHKRALQAYLIDNIVILDDVLRDEKLKELMTKKNEEGTQTLFKDEMDKAEARYLDDTNKENANFIQKINDLDQSIRLDDKNRATVGKDIDKMTVAFFEEYNKQKASYGGSKNVVKNLERTKAAILNSNKFPGLEFIVNVDELSKFSSFFDGMRDLVIQLEKRFGDKGLTFSPSFTLDTEIEGEIYKGEIDLLVTTASGEAMIYDFKSRKPGEKNVKMWDYNFGEYFKGGLETVTKTKRNDVALQTSFYSLLMENLGFKVIDRGAIYVEAETVNTNGIVTAGDVKIKVSKDSVTIGLASYKAQLQDILFKKRAKSKKDLEKDFKKGHLNTFKDVMDVVTEGNDINSSRISARKWAMRPYTNKETEEEGFRDKAGVFIAFDSENIEERIKQAKPYMKDIINMNNVFVSEMTNFFYGDENVFNKNQSKHSVAVNMLRGISQRDYDLLPLVDLPGFENSTSPVLVAINRFTGDRKLLYFAPSSSAFVPFSDEDRKGLYGAFYSDFAGKKNINNEKATTDNFRKMELGLIAIQMKNIDRDVRIDIMKVSNGFRENVLPDIFYMDNALQLVKPLKGILEKSEHKTAGFIANAFSKYETFQNSYYNPNYIYNLADEIMNLGVSDFAKDKYLESFNAYQNNMLNRGEMLTELGKLERSLVHVLEKDGKDPYKDKKYLVVANAIKHLAGVENKLINTDLSNLTKMATIEQNMPEYHRQKMATITKNNDHRIRTQFDTFRIEHSKLLKKLAESRNVEFSERNINPSLLGLYDNLYKNPNWDYSDIDGLMTLKSPNDSSLRTAEKNYIKFINKHMKMAMKRTGYRKYDNIKEGFVPTYEATLQTRRVKLNAKGEYLKEMFDIVDQDRKVKANIAKQDIAGYFTMENELADAYNNSDTMNGVDFNEAETLKRKNFDVNGIETNLEYILDRAVGTSLNYESHTDTLLIAKAIKVSLMQDVDEFGGENAVKDVLDGMETFLDMSVKGVSDQGGALNEIVGKINQAATNLAIISTRQMVMDSATYLLGSTATIISNTLFKAFGGDVDTPGYFSTESWMKAGSVIMSQPELYNAIMREYAIDTTDVKRLIGRSEKLSMRADFTEVAFKVSRGAMLMAHMHVFVANMIEDGSFNAYSMKDGHLVYDETKDLRFYTKNGKIKNKIFLDAIKGQMELDSTMGISEDREIVSEEKNDDDELISKTELIKVEDRKLLRGYTSIEINNIRNRSSAMLGVFDKDGFSKIQKWAMLKSMFKFMTWMQSKMDLYYMEQHKSDTLKMWKKYTDEFGNEGYVAEAMIQEGILQSLLSISTKSYGAIVGKLAKGEFNITDIEKRNLAIFTSHITMALSVLALNSLFKMNCKDKDGNPQECFLEHTAAGKSTKSMINNVQSDMFILTAFIDIVNGEYSFFSGFSVVGNLGVNTAGLFLDVLFPSEEDASDPDFSRVTEVNNYMKRSFSIYRSIYEPIDFAQWMSEEEERKKKY